MRKAHLRNNLVSKFASAHRQARQMPSASSSSCSLSSAWALGPASGDRIVWNHLPSEDRSWAKLRFAAACQDEDAVFLISTAEAIRLILTPLLANFAGRLDDPWRVNGF